MDPEKLWYTEDHEWIGEVNSVYAVGITQHAQEALGDITFVELPELEREVAAQEETAVVESVKAASDVYAPVSGRVVQVNSELETRPELVNQDPYGKGWFYKLADVITDDLNELMSADEYRAYLAKLEE
ncbi:MAG: glycine cleavage system protein GcvH [Candidatus Hydrogenedentes bacterium]|nr:glycine cleavage system protein GcvH [Candidatus Hydrogenedentota bacterium]